MLGQPFSQFRYRTILVGTLSSHSRGAVAKRDGLWRKEGMTIDQATDARRYMYIPGRGPVLFRLVHLRNLVRTSDASQPVE